MPIPIHEQPPGEGPPFEKCCFCGHGTGYWTSLPDRTLGEQVACCPKCARVNSPSKVPTKDEWFAWATRHERRMIHNVEFDRAQAEDHQKRLQNMGRRTKIYPRTIKAEGLSQTVYVVVTDIPREVYDDEDGTRHIPLKRGERI